MKIFTINWKPLIILFIVTIALLFTGNAIAQTDINVNSTNLIRVGGGVMVAERQVVENAIAIGGSTIVQPNGRVTQTAIAIGGNVILKKGARVDGDAYAIGGKVVQAEGAIISGSQGTVGGSQDTFNDQLNDQYGGRGMMGMHRDRNQFFPMYFFHASFRILSAIIGAILGVDLVKNRTLFSAEFSSHRASISRSKRIMGNGGSVCFCCPYHFSSDHPDRHST